MPAGHRKTCREAIDAEVQRLAAAVEPRTRQGLRDRALMLLGFAGALRRSELVAFDVEHLKQCPEGLILEIASSKTDPEGDGQTIAIPRVADSAHCPVQAVLDWLVVAEIGTGALFLRMHRGDAVGKTRLTAQSVAPVIKDLALRTGLDPTRYVHRAGVCGCYDQPPDGGVKFTRTESTFAYFEALREFPAVIKTCPHD